jgi:hypothetical protein
VPFRVATVIEFEATVVDTVPSNDVLDVRVIERLYGTPPISDLAVALSPLKLRVYAVPTTLTVVPEKSTSEAPNDPPGVVADTLQIPFNSVFASTPEELVESLLHPEIKPKQTTNNKPSTVFIRLYSINN